MGSQSFQNGKWPEQIRNRKKKQKVARYWHFYGRYGQLSKWLLKTLKSFREEFPDGLAVGDSTFSLLCLRFDPWPGTFHMPRAWCGGKKKKSFGEYHNAYISKDLHPRSLYQPNLSHLYTSIFLLYIHWNHELYNGIKISSYYRVKDWRKGSCLHSIFVGTVVVIIENKIAERKLCQS